MSHDPDNFVTLMERMREGCPDAIGEVLNRYGGHIREVVRQRLDPRLRTQFDSIDFQQDVWAAFFSGNTRHNNFDCPQALVRFLSQIASNKVANIFRQQVGAARRNIKRECSLEQLQQQDKADSASAMTARHPSPSQIAMANEKWERLLDKQPPHQRRILELLQQGYTHEEVAQKLDLSSKFVQRFLNTLKARGDSQ